MAMKSPKIRIRLQESEIMLKAVLFNSNSDRTVLIRISVPCDLDWIAADTDSDIYAFAIQFVAWLKLANEMRNPTLVDHW
jgi:hypothetical protein